jgi:hypothetical protein
MTDSTLKIQTVTGHIKPLASETRLRELYSTYADYYPTTYGINDTVEIDQIIERLETSADPMKPHDRAGDLWGRVTKINGVAIQQPSFMAIQYHHKTTFSPVQICSRHYTITGEPDPTPGPAPVVDLIDLIISNNDKTLIIRGKENTAWRIYFQDDLTLEKTQIK